MCLPDLFSWSSALLVRSMCLKYHHSEQFTCTCKREVGNNSICVYMARTEMHTMQRKTEMVMMTGTPAMENVRKTVQSSFDSMDSLVGEGVVVDNARKHGQR